MLDDLSTLINVESPSRDLDALGKSASVLAGIIEQRLGTTPTLIETSAGPMVHWSGGGSAKVLIVGHHDTVHPLGSLAERPFTVADGRATGPGVFDMKGGIVQAIHAVAALDDRSGIEMLWTADEEVGSLASVEFLSERAIACGAVLVMEPSGENGALKIARKGVGTFEVRIHGRASHAGLEPEKGVNALVEAAHQVLIINTFGQPEIGTTVTPTVARIGTTDNVVPALAELLIDVRVESAAEKDRLETAMALLTPHDPETRIEVRGGLNRPPMPASASEWLFPIAESVAADLGWEVTGLAVGGGSDGNFTAALGVATLDGLGAVGGGAHSETEHLVVDEMPRRSALLAGILTALQRR
ncbi:MAG: M20 family metallopeptidase [Ilumatobacteraceae bacterium]